MSPIAQDSLNTAWLDEELRKEKAIVAELRDTTAKQQVMLSDQAQRLLSLEERLAKLQAQLLRIPEVEEALRNTRDEIVLMIAELRQEQQKRETEFLRNRQAEREQDVRASHRIEMELKRFDPLEQAVAARQAEERRLNEVTLRLQQELEDLTKRLLQREEVNRQLADRIEHHTTKIGQMDLSLGEIQKIAQEYLSRLLLVETALPKVEQKITEISNLRQELTKQNETLLETMRRSEREQAQALTEWARKVEGYGHQLEVWADQLRHFTDQHDKNRRVLREVQELSHQISQQQDQLRQTQRLAEEQLRNEFREWRGENDRRWAQETERRGKATEAQANRDDTQDQRLSNIEQLRQQDVAVINTLHDSIQVLRSDLLVLVDKSRQVQLRILQLQAKASQDILAELQGALSQEGK